MHSAILFLLIVGLSIANAGVGEIKKDLVQFLEHGNENPIDSNDHHLQLLNDRLGSTDLTLVWKGLFDGHQEVAVKIFTNQSNADQEIAGYRAAKAMDDPDIESKGIPKIYYTGHIFKKYPVIVMTLFDETLYDRWMKQNLGFNAYTTLEVFLQLAKTLNYLQSRGVLHNDIKLENIFLRGNEVFLGDFDIATCDRKPTKKALSRRRANLGNRSTRNFMFDLESLVYTIWCIEGIEYYRPSSLTISANENYKEYVLEKCKHFKKFPQSFEALNFICNDEMLSGKSNPDYESIVSHLTEAIAEVQEITKQTSFEWLGSESPKSSSPSLSF